MAGVKRNIQEMYNSHNGNGNNNNTNGNNLITSNNSNPNSMSIDLNNDSGTNPNEAKKSRLDNQSKQEPSRVVHLRNIPHQLTENEIIFLGLSFGNIKNVLFLRSKNQAFLEFEIMQDAQQMIHHFNNSSTTFSGKKIFVQYSNHQELNTDPSNSNNLVAQAALNEAVQLHKSAKMGGKNTVLRATILNMIYPVTLDVLHQIFSKFGNVLKIITFNKNDKFQVLIQMKDPMMSQNAKQSLHGQNIYNGCCTLQIDFSKLTTLEVRFNNDKSRDYTNLLLPTGDGQSQPTNINASLSNLNDIGMQQNSQHGMSGMSSNHSLSSNGMSGGGGGMNGSQSHHMSALQYQQQQQQSLIGNPPNLYGNMNSNGNSNNQQQQMSFNPSQPHHHQHQNHLSSNMNNSMHQQQNSYNINLSNQMGVVSHHSQQQQHNQQQHNQLAGQGQVGGGPSGSMSTPVLLVSNLNEEFVTTDALFTLFGVYGDVLRVKILFNKKDSALINFSNSQQASTALANLDRAKLWQKQIRVFPSKHLTVQMPKDGQPDSGLTKDFSNSPLHRFKKPGSKNFNNIFPPSQTLHLSNIPPNVTEQELRDLFGMYGQVKAFKFFQKDRKMALLQMEQVEEAITALIATHNYQLADNMHLRCTFSKATI